MNSSFIFRFAASTLWLSLVQILGKAHGHDLSVMTTANHNLFTSFSQPAGHESETTGV